MEKTDKIFLAGHQGLVGSNILKQLQNKGYQKIILKTRHELDLENQKQTADFFQKEKPDYVILAAAKVGGIVANNTYRADFIYKNIQIQTNVIHHSYIIGVKKLLFLGSSCVYPKKAPQPMPEDCLLTSELEYTNEPYAITKISGMKMCEAYNLQYGCNFLCAMPANLYGIGDNFDLEHSHVLAALIRKIHLAKLLSENKQKEVFANLKIKTQTEAQAYLEKFGICSNSVEIWGTGRPEREFLYAEDLADACVFLMEQVDFGMLVETQNKEVRNTHINIGTGKTIAIKELAELIKEIIGFSGELVFNSTMPDGTMKKVTNTEKINKLGWHYKTSLREGIEKVYENYRNLC